MTILGTPTAGTKENLRTMQLLITALLIGIIFFAGIVIILLSINGTFLQNDTQKYCKILFYSVIGLGLGCYFFASTIYKRKVDTINNSALSLTGKLNQYRTILILYMACCEGPALFSIVALLLTGNYWYLLITGSMMLAMAVKFPFTPKIINLLNIDWKEQQNLI